MELSELLHSHGDDAPSGENLEYDPAFITLELAAQPGEERQVGDSIIAAEDPDFGEVVVQAMEVLGRAHDIRAAVFLAHARLRIDGFSGFAAVTAYVRGCLEQWWDTCHPQLDADDDNDPTMRVNAVASLADGATILRALRMAPMTESRSFGRLTLRDIMVAEGETALAEGEESSIDQAAVAAAFRDTDPDALQAMHDAVRAALDDVRAMGAVFDDKIPGRGPDMEVLEKLLRQILGKFSAAGVGAAEADEAAEEAEVAGEVAAIGTAPVRAAGGPPGAINNQQDVRAALDRIIAYYARQEPSSPLPLLLERAKRLVGADFMTIIKDMAPDGRTQVRTIGGLADEEEY